MTSCAATRYYQAPDIILTWQKYGRWLYFNRNYNGRTFTSWEILCKPSFNYYGITWHTTKRCNQNNLF
ncbi:5135_t:CDS:2 [Entrophospora sp. SA101]|nr:5135_t:CDS:2 [Entrophospora sp. SA101]CAJ0842796.1 9499_t:CDS:2 [Entrophospora sp. SA101]CAJ0860781.1 15833_t:CDS:2 [Entrophospora sp. SA101]CAJ0913575.1 9052_t:CDS:2 [Entrophospora sp. SA101]